MVISGPTSAAQLTFSAQSLEVAGVQAKSVEVELSGDEPTRLEAKIGELALAGETWRDVRLRCNCKLMVGAREVTGQFALNNFQFSGAQGLHAGENIAGEIALQAQREQATWNWRAELDWRTGEIFWSPLYLRGGHRMVALGSLTSDAIRVAKGELKLQEIGEATFSASWNRNANQLTSAQLSAKALELPELYEKILQPFLATTAAGKLRTSGLISFELSQDKAGIQSLELHLHDVHVDDKEQRYGVFGVNAHIPWRRDAPTRAEVRVDGGELLQIPFGATRLEPELRGFSVSLPHAQIPVLDGALELGDFHAERAGQEWRWRLKAVLSAISMETVTAALGLPTMYGSLSAMVPEVRYAASTFAMDGALLIDVFDGAIEVRNLSILEPFGLTPRLSADVSMRRLDLDRLTRTFSFGSISGRIDVTVDDLVLANWRPVAFDAKLQSSAGDYPRRISQRAVENISALGGAGAAAALQRSLLGFFDEFGYSRIGWSCKLENGVCHMGGIESAASGYVIVKGGGIPAITVIGYNRRVDWSELIERVRRVTRQDPYVVE